MKIVVINGQPTVGKDLFVDLCKKLVGPRCLNVSTVDFVKKIATECGWNGEKNAKNREFLSNLKDLLTEWNDVPFNKVMLAIKCFHDEAIEFIEEDNLIAFIHCREPKEIQKFVDRANAITLLIRRPSVENNNQSNHADAEVLNYNYNYTIINEGTIEDLQWKAESFLNKLNIAIDKFDI